jgi:carboxypeptidase C (cathepsin A)
MPMLVCAALCLSALARAETSPRSFISEHTATISGKPVRFEANFEEFLVPDGSGTTALSLFATSYIRKDPEPDVRRPVVFIFNGGPSAAATGLHMQLGPRQTASGGDAAGEGALSFADNSDSLLDVADLVMFDPAETGYSRVLPGGRRDYFYGVAGDAYSLAQLVEQWLVRHGRQSSPRYLLGESYGSVRAVVTADVLAKRGNPLDGVILFGDSIFLQETSRRTHNIISTAVSLPVLAMTAAYHGKANKHGKSDAQFLDEVYNFATTDYLLALAKGHTLSESSRRQIAQRLAQYTGIPSDYYLSHDLAIAKQDFNHDLLPGKLLDANDTRVARPAPPPAITADAAREQRTGNSQHPPVNVYGLYLQRELKVDLPGLEYRDLAPDSFWTWGWGNGCNAYLLSAGLCTTNSDKPNVFEDYDWPELLKRQFARPQFRAMIIAGYYDGLSSIGTHRYLQAQLGFPSARFELHEYAGGHATSADPVARPLVSADVRSFLLRGQR